jgi:hypothetical protein
MMHFRYSKEKILAFSLNEISHVKFMIFFQQL